MRLLESAKLAIASRTPSSNKGEFEKLRDQRRDARRTKISVAVNNTLERADAAFGQLGQPEPELFPERPDPTAPVSTWFGDDLQTDSLAIQQLADKARRGTLYKTSGSALDGLPAGDSPRRIRQPSEWPTPVVATNGHTPGKVVIEESMPVAASAASGPDLYDQDAGREGKKRLRPPMPPAYFGDLLPQAPAAAPEPKHGRRRTDRPVKLFDVADHQPEVLTPHIKHINHFRVAKRFQPRKGGTFYDQDSRDTHEEHPSTHREIATVTPITHAPSRRREAPRTHSTSASGVEQNISRLTNNVSTRQEIRSAIRNFTENVQSRKLKWLDETEAQSMYIDLLNTLTASHGPLNSAETDHVKKIEQDIMKFVSKRAKDPAFGPVYAGQVRKMAAFIDAYFGEDYDKRMSGFRKRGARNEFFNAFIDAYRSASKQSRALMQKAA